MTIFPTKTSWFQREGGELQSRVAPENDVAIEVSPLLIALPALPAEENGLLMSLDVSRMPSGLRSPNGAALPRCVFNPRRHAYPPICMQPALLPSASRTRLCLALLAICLAAGLAATHAAPPSVQALLPGKWPTLPQVNVNDVKVVGNFAYDAIGYDGLAVFDVSNPTNLIHVGGYNTRGCSFRIAVLGNYAYVADLDAGLQVIDVSNPTSCVRVGGYDTSGAAWGVAVVTDRIYVADGEQGLLVLPALPNVQFTVRVGAATNMPFTLDAATDLSGAGNWSPLVTTNVPAMPFDFVDFDVKLTNQPQKFYRVRQP